MSSSADAVTSDLWGAVERLVVRAPSTHDLRVHRLEPFAARRLRALGAPVPAEILHEERLAAVASLVATTALERIRAACEGRVLVMKGPEIASLYPDPALRAYRDLDLLVDDADGTQHALIAAGFEEVGDPSRYTGIHHLRPLVAPGLPVGVEVHSRPKWPEGLPGPSPTELLEAGIPSATGVDGVLGLPPALHALVLASHSWAHEPLRRLRDLVDVGAACRATTAREVDALAAAWGVGRMWRTTRSLMTAVFDDGRFPLLLRPWARHVLDVRERTVLENHFTRLLSGFGELPPSAALARLLRMLGNEVRPAPDERWRDKLTRTALALGHAGYARGAHERTLDEYDV